MIFLKKKSGKEIKEIIKNNTSLSQNELASICTVSKTLVSYWLNEKRVIPDDKYQLIMKSINGVDLVLTDDVEINNVHTDTKYDEIRKDLLDQLEKKNKYGTHYEDLVDHAVYLFTLKDQLQKDIETHGLRVTMSTGNGHNKEVDNASIRHLNQVSSQLLRVLKDFDLESPNLDSDDFDESDFT